jgi:putative transcriptional regulator
MKTSFGQSVVEGLTELAETLEKGSALSEKFTCSRVVLELEPTPYDPALVRATRRLLGASQAVFAQFLGVSVKTVQAWERGTNTPSDMACRFLDEIRHAPAYWRGRLKAVIVRKSGRAGKVIPAR